MFKESEKIINHEYRLIHREFINVMARYTQTLIKMAAASFTKATRDYGYKHMAGYRTKAVKWHVI